MDITNNKNIKRNEVAEIEYLRHELENLIGTKENNFDNEVLRISKKLDNVLNRYYSMKLEVETIRSDVS